MKRNEIYTKHKGQISRQIVVYALTYCSIMNGACFILLDLLTTFWSHTITYLMWMWLRGSTVDGYIHLNVKWLHSCWLVARTDQRRFQKEMPFLEQWLRDLIFEACAIQSTIHKKMLNIIISKLKIIYKLWIISPIRPVYNFNDFH